MSVSSPSRYKGAVMSTPTPLETKIAATIHPATRLGHVHYTVIDLDRQVAFYQKSLGFKLHWRDGEDLLQLTENPGARRVRGTTGLYHTAFLVPSRLELAQLLRRLAETRTPIEGTNDHGTHLAIYLPDAEGNGIELAWDRSRDQWPRSFQEAMAKHGRFPFEALIREVENEGPWEGVDRATTVGHVHLHVADLPATERFYRDLLGFQIPEYLKNPPPQFLDSGRFFSAGGYHHHIGTNIWNGIGAPPPPADATGLRYFTVVLPSSAELEPVLERIRVAGIAAEQTPEGTLVRDPAANGLLLTANSHDGSKL
jgi:catechol 2,3-dioxygenase